MKRAEQVVTAWCRLNPYGNPCMRRTDSGVAVIAMDRPSSKPLKLPGGSNVSRIDGATWSDVAIQLGISH